MKDSGESRKSLAEELQETRHDLMHVSRLAQTGQLLASILHEIHQPLLAVQLHSSAGREILQNPGISRPALERIFADITECIDFATGIVTSLRALSSKHPLELRPTDVNEALTDVVRLAEIEARTRAVTMQVNLAPVLPWINGDRISLEHAVLDLIVNALEAVEECERRVVTVESVLVGDEIEIHVSDTGGGIDEANRARLFHAFFTTKPQGTGLGLAVARTIVEAHGGSIRAENNADGGASFRIGLPTVHAARSG